MQKTILLVDDDKVLLLATKKFLQETYKVIAVGSARLAQNYLTTHTPDLILLDLMMPEMDGFEFMNILQANENWKNIPVIFLTADSSCATEAKCLECGASDFVIKPFVPIILSSRIRHALVVAEYNKSLKHKVENQKRRITTMQSDILTSLANLIESRDGTTGGHVKRTKIYVNYLVSKLQCLGIYSNFITEHFSNLIIAAAPLHDIGKINVPDIILSKPGKFTPEEFEIMKNHAAEGGRLIKENMGNLAEQDFVEMAYNLATYHHERWNGGGYPHGLKNFEIPLAARIMAVADVYDALTSKRSYKEIFPFEEAVKIISEGKGACFEPCIVEAFLNDTEELRKITQFAKLEYNEEN